MANYEIHDHTDEVKQEINSRLEAALEAVGITAEGYAKLLCPVDTSRLQNSITHDVRANEKAVYIGTDVEYAAYVEMGTSRQKAQPYLRPAATEHTEEYRQLFDQYLK